MLQLLCHLVGDYLLQTERMALNKSKDSLICITHCITYSLPFAYFLHLSYASVLLIFSSHFILDRFSLAKFFCKFRNMYVDCIDEHKVCEITGLRSDRIESIKWLVYIVTDNTFHLLCNYLAIAYFT